MIMAKYIAGGAAFANTPGLKKRYTGKSTYGDPIILWKEADDGTLWIPRYGKHTEDDRRVEGCTVNSTTTFVPRNIEQARLVKESVNLLQNDQSHILESPTGSGKTVMALEIIRQLGRQAIIIVTKEDVKSQWIQAFKKFWGLDSKDIGILQGNRYDIAGKKVSIAMIQSVYKPHRYPAWVYKSFGLMVVDEVHRLAADKFSQAAWQFAAKYRLGLSATPYRRDGKGMVFTSHIGPVAVKTEVMTLIPKILVYQVKNSRVRHTKHTPGRTGHMSKILAVDVNRNSMIGEFIGAAYAQGRSILILSDTLQHLEVLNDYTLMHSVKRTDIGKYIGGLSPQERERVKRLRVVFATYQMASEATDAPWWDTLVLATPKAQVKQIVGRILREWEGKQQPIVMDIVDISSRIFQNYFKSRVKWYTEIKAEIKVMTRS